MPNLNPYYLPDLLNAAKLQQIMLQRLQPAAVVAGPQAVHDLKMCIEVTEDVIKKVEGE